MPELMLKKTDLPPGTGRVVLVGTREVAVFCVDGDYYALLNECPHVGGPLGEGRLDGSTVVCPWHAWAFDVRTGQCDGRDRPATRVTTTDAGDWIRIEVA